VERQNIFRNYVKGRDFIKTVQNILKYLIMLLLVMTAVGLVILTNAELSEKYIWTTTVFLTVQFVTLVLYMILNYELKSLSILIPLMLVSGYLIEYAGVKTGYPFGEYLYTDKLKPQLFNIPVAISLSWVVVVVSSFLVVFSNNNPNLFTKIIYSSLLVLGLDLMLEPFAAFKNAFWIWKTGFVPVQNYISWFFIAAIFSSILGISLRERNNKSGGIMIIKHTPLIIFAINIIQFTVVNFMNTYYLYTISGLVLISAVLYIKNRGTVEV